MSEKFVPTTPLNTPERLKEEIKAFREGIELIERAFRGRVMSGSGLTDIPHAHRKPLSSSVNSKMVGRKTHPTYTYDPHCDATKMRRGWLYRCGLHRSHTGPHTASMSSGLKTVAWVIWFALAVGCCWIGTIWLLTNILSWVAPAGWGLG